MEIAKIRLKNNASTLMGLVGMMLVAIVMFFAIFSYIGTNASQSGQTVDQKYQDSYDRLATTQSSIDDKVHEIQGSAEGITEASDIWQVAWNGLKFLGSTLSLPLAFVSMALGVWDSMVTGMDIFPTWITAAILVGITAFVVLLTLSILKGDPKLID